MNILKPSLTYFEKRSNQRIGKDCADAKNAFEG